MRNSSMASRWVLSSLLWSSVLMLGGCFPPIGNSEGTCAAGATCNCNGIGNCTQSCPGGNCHFVCTGIGNCITSCAGGGCDLMCSGTGNCTLDCSGGNCASNCIGRTNCTCTHCSESDAGATDAGDAGASGDAATSSDANIDANAADTSAGDASHDASNVYDGDHG